MPVVLGVSQRFQPVMWEHLRAFGRAASSAGCEISFLLSHQYANLIADPRQARVEYLTPLQGLQDISPFTSTSRLHRRSHWRYINRIAPQIAYFENIAPFTPAFSQRLKHSLGVKILLHVHEPAILLRRTLSQRVKSLAYREVLASALDTSDGVILSSSRAESLFRLHWPQYQGQIFLLPLMFDTAFPVTRKSFHTFIGNPIPERGFERFLDAADISLRHRMPHRFQVVCRQDPGQRALALAREFPDSFKLVSANPLTELQIAEAAAASYSVFLLFTQDLTQSGVIPVALGGGAIPVVPDSRPESLQLPIGCPHFEWPSQHVSTEEVGTLLASIEAASSKSDSDLRLAYSNNYHWASRTEALSDIIERLL